MRTRTQEKGAVTPQETDPDLAVSVQESSVEACLPTKVRLVKAMVFPVVTYGCELDCEEG